VATTAGALPAQHVIHVPTIDYQNRRRATVSEIERGARAALDRACELGCRSIAFPLLGAGVVGLPTVEVARAMLLGLRDTDLDVTLCAYSRSDREALREALEESG
jgi:O-acetyl-ADP-ribose deacetylase (regulator of RNase III)